jgi:hypothetical protein
MAFFPMAAGRHFRGVRACCFVARAIRAAGMGGRRPHATEMEFLTGFSGTKGCDFSTGFYS